MDSIKELRDKLQTLRPAAWEQLPDLELYKDQVLAYMQRQLPLSGNEELLSGAMINNYVKAGAMPRANGKKYAREHLAALTAICTLKPVLSLGDIKLLLEKSGEGLDAESFYNVLCAGTDAAMDEAAQMLDKDFDPDDLTGIVLTSALLSVGYRIVAEHLLAVLREEEKK